MVRTCRLAALILAVGYWPCSAQFGGMGGMGGGGMVQKVKPLQTWTIRVDSTKEQVVTGQLKLQDVAVECDLGTYRLKPEKIKVIEFEPKGDHDTLNGPEGFIRKGTVTATTGEKIVGTITVSYQWEIETDLGSLAPGASGIKSITFVEQVAAQPNKPGDPQKPAGKPGQSQANEPKAGG